jgi:S-methylmethionine-dependent homocysteine/selenocysteine methylase
MKTPSPFRKRLYLADGGFETTLIYHEGIALNHFAAFELLNDAPGRQALRRYYSPYIDLARRYALPYLLETPTWRSNPDWSYKLGYSQEEIFEINRDSVRFLWDLIPGSGMPSGQILLSGAIGPRGDGYIAGQRMTITEASDYHDDQVRAFAEGEIHVVSAMTMTYSEEATGIVEAAKTHGMPVVVSFTVETDGILPSGETLREAIGKVDADTNGYAAHFMINCAHPQHFMQVLRDGGAWTHRIRGIRANASALSHAELDSATTLDAGDRHALAADYATLKTLLPGILLVGGCCGTDHSHMEEICRVMA